MRRDLRLSQAKLASLTGTTQSAIARLEAGHLSPSVRTLERVYAALGKELRLLAMPSPDQYSRSIAVPELRLAESRSVMYDAHREADIDLSQIRAARRLTVPQRIDYLAAGHRGIQQMLRMMGR
jgi:transcriptional regulator with XRE-family HTH domain